jgi:hypothetical protein
MSYIQQHSVGFNTGQNSSDCGDFNGESHYKWNVTCSDTFTVNNRLSIFLDGVEIKVPITHWVMAF